MSALPRHPDLCLVCGRIAVPMIFRGTGWCSEDHRRVVKGIASGDGPTDITEFIRRYPWEHAAMVMGIQVRGVVSGKPVPWIPDLLSMTYQRMLLDRGNTMLPTNPGPIPRDLRDAWSDYAEPDPTLFD